MKNLKFLRQQHNLSQQALADKLHISQQSVYKYEHNLTSPDFETLIAIANFFNTSVDYLIGNTEISHKIEVLTDTMLNDNELILIENYRKMSNSQRNALNHFLTEFAQNKQELNSSFYNALLSSCRNLI